MLSAKRAVQAVLGLALATAAGTAWAVNYTWDVTKSGIWEDGSNWIGGSGSDYPDGLDDNAYINYGTGSDPTRLPTVQTTGPITVGTLRFGQGWSADARLVLGGDLTVNQFRPGAIYGSANFLFDQNAYTMRVVGTNAAWSADECPAWGWELQDGTLRFEGSGTFSPRYGANYGDTFITDDGGDTVTILGTGNIPNFNKRLVFGPGTTHLNGNLRAFNTAGTAFEIAPGATIDGLLTANNGLYLNPLSQTLPTGIFGARVWSDPWYAGPTYTMTGALTLGELALNSVTTGPTTVFDVTAANHPLSITNGLTVSRNATLRLRSAVAAFGDVTINHPDGKIEADPAGATLTVSGNWDTDDPTQAGAWGDELSLGQSLLTFTGTGTIEFYAPDELNHQSVFHMGFLSGASYALLSDVYSTGGDLILDGALTNARLLAAAGVLDRAGFNLYGFNQIPEPASGLLLVLAGALAATRRTRRA
ncbi:MAG: hypothetical protein BWZ02_02900 [Lentisphaerae bacterium ADurb.BinA184]|nr:MAG: hypothetical protein BWZ02_02900 [Lentisphaerae bacterium ADurb.BinA184]